MELLLGVQDTMMTVAALPMQLPDSGPLAPPGIGDAWNRMVGVGKWIALGVAVLGILVIAGKMAFDARRGETTEEVGGLIKVVLAVVLISGGASMVGFITGTGGGGDEAAEASVVGSTTIHSVTVETSSAEHIVS